MKQTLEEAAENSFLANKLENSNAVEKAHYIAGFRESAKWQQERSYSEEEVFFFIREALYDTDIRYDRISVEDWFEQFKKK